MGFGDDGRGRAFYISGATAMGTDVSEIAVDVSDHSVPGATSDNLGSRSTSGGDVNGDGAADALIVAGNANAISTTYLFLGGSR